MAAVHAIVMLLHPSPAGLLVGALGVAYGIRLLWFVHAREKSASYAPAHEQGRLASQKVVLPFRIFMWLSVSWLMIYAGQPAYRAALSGALTPGLLAGAVMMVLGLLLEAVADQQKQAVKAADPATFVRTGLYRHLRHPNYLGEAIFHAGLIVVVLGTGLAGRELLAACLAPAYLIALMIYTSLDGDEKQLKRYGNDPAWREWRAGTLF
jgi:steroid 5-alpha reductase family enzyme